MGFISTSITIWSFRKVLKYVVFTFLLVLSLPFIAVIILLNTGMNLISDQLVINNNGIVQILDPVDGKPKEKITEQPIWPVNGVITLEFGASSGYQVFHTGIDIASSKGKVGDPIVAFMNGKVIHVGELSWGYGKHVIIDHGNDITSVYTHLDTVSVTEGQVINQGDQIGTMGNTGWSTGPHLHFEVRILKIPVNPRRFLNS